MYRTLLIEKWNPSERKEHQNYYCWRNERGEVHRNGDQPAIVFDSGAMRWFKNGERHRGNNKPAAIEPDGTMRWFKNGIECTSFGQRKRERVGESPENLLLIKKH